MPRPDSELLQKRLDALAARHGVPGAAAGVLAGGELTVATTGVTHALTGERVRPDTLFLIASITKVWTATLVLQLAEEGLVDLDVPVADQMDPRLRLADEELARTVTVAQLLCHTGGFLGDAGESPERGDAAVRATVEGYANAPRVHTPGALFSYSNSGYNVLGRLVENVTGTTWDEALRVRIIEPLGLRHTATLPEDIMVHPHAVGHEPHGGSLALRSVERWLDPRGSGPCGGTLATTVPDLLAFAAMHIADGRAPDGTQVLSAGAARAMREPRIAQPDPAHSPFWGWGWAVERVEGPRVVEHGGNTCGQESQLVVVPEEGVAVAVLTNGDPQGLLRQQLVNGLLDDVLGLRRPGNPQAVRTQVDTAPFVGTYSRGDGLEIDVRPLKDGTLESRFTVSSETGEPARTFTSTFSYAGGTTFLLTVPPMTEQITATFVREDQDEGPASHLSLGLRAAPRL